MTLFVGINEVGAISATLKQEFEILLIEFQKIVMGNKYVR